MKKIPIIEFCKSDPYNLEIDPTSSLYYFSARWYDSLLGIFLQRDVVEDIYSRYVIAENNPLITINPTGELSIRIGEYATCYQYNIILNPDNCKAAKGEPIRCWAICKAANWGATIKGNNCPNPQKCPNMKCNTIPINIDLPIRLIIPIDKILGPCKCDCKIQIKGEFKVCSYRKADCCP